MFVLRNLSITKKTKIILLVFLLLIALAVVLYAFNLLPSIKKGVETIKNNNRVIQTTNEDRSIAIPDLNTTNQNSLPELQEISDEDKNSFVLPVDEKYMDTVFINEAYSQSYSFLLDAGTEVKAVFSGKITKIFNNLKPLLDVDYSFEEIRLESEGGKYQASYYLLGEVMVKENDIIKSGEVLAKIKSTGPDFKSGINFTFSLRNKEGEMIKLTKEIFKIGGD